MTDTEPIILKKKQFYKITATPKTTIEWCRNTGLLAKKSKCNKCNKDMILVPYKGIDGEIWKCRGHKCKHSTISIRNGSFFFKSKLAISVILTIMYEWSNMTSSQIIKDDIEVSYKTLNDWFRFLRDIAAHMNIKNQKMLGGIGRTVEIDETLLVRRKYNVGRIKKQIWLFGGIDREDGKLFMEIVEDRTEKTLIDVLERVVEKDTRVLSDMWKGYTNIANNGWLHETVNHSTNFLNPQDKSINTQRIEATWGILKKYLRNKGTNRNKYLSEYIEEYLFRKEATHVFHELIKGVKDLYKVE